MTTYDPFASHTEFEDQLGLRFDEPRPARRIWPVRDLVAQVRELVEQEYGDIWVEGEISNYRPAPSGHLYFTLKDADAQLPIVLFRRQAVLLRFRPEDGLHVLVRGRVSVYEQRGQMQLVAETMEPVGAGSLQLAFEQLKERLKAEGLFDAARKRPLPLFPRCVGIVTSPTGAVIRDFVNIVSRRHSGLNILLYPVSVQGDSAPAEIEAALTDLNAARLVDLIVLARGGGSLEDLAAFNSERVARAIVSSRLPVVSAVGHETDFTIADFAADVRASTPSAAAELVVRSREEFDKHLDQLRHKLARGVRYKLLEARHRLRELGIHRAERELKDLLRRNRQHTDELTAQLAEGLRGRLERLRRRYTAAQTRLLAIDLRARFRAFALKLSQASSGLSVRIERTLVMKRRRLERLRLQLEERSPLRVLERGYAICYDAAGRVVRDADGVAIGDRVRVQLSRGALGAEVKDKS